MDNTINTIGGVILFTLLLFAIAYMGNTTSANDALGFKADGNPTPDCRVVEVRTEKIHYKCADGRDVWEKRNLKP